MIWGADGALCYLSGCKHEVFNVSKDREALEVYRLVTSICATLLPNHSIYVKHKSFWQQIIAQLLTPQMLTKNQEMRYLF